MLAIPGYQILAQIYESASSLVYRGRRYPDNQPVVLKILKHDYPTPSELARYEQEYEILRSLKLEGVLKAYDLLKYQNTLVMIVEDFGGESLKILMATQKFTLLGFLTLAIKITESLGEIHAANIIHKDINPSNIVFNPVTGQVKIVDFSIASVLTRETTAIKNPNVLEGTLFYMSPEQTGRMNRSLDYRTDFYSLGATFYEVLVGRPPFETTDAMELVHCHIAKQPVPLDRANPEIPKAVSDMVMKLLAKTAEKRYQSAWGLKADLEECLDRLQTTGNIEEFPLGRQDISERFQIPQKLYGRDREVETLMAAFDRVSQKGQTEMMLVAGYSGIGKSALVQVLVQPITRKQGYFISGKFDQFQRTIPYSAVVSAFSELVRQLLTETEEQLAKWREKLLAAFGPNGQIIIDVIPEVELIVGPQPPVAALGPQESQNRFNLVFQNFIRVFCAIAHPLVIFLDDLQWADSATLKLIDLMMTDDQTQYLLAIGAYRDNEVSPTHPLIMTLEALRRQEAIINEIILTPLNLDNLAQLTADTLHNDPKLAYPLAELILRKTQGNPFFVNEFLKTLYQENLLTFIRPTSERKGGWQWDIEQIEALGITDNVVELMIGKLKKLPAPTQQVLRLVACLGNQFELNTLCLIYEKEAAEAFQDLLPALQEGLILPVSDLDSKEIELINFPLLILNYKFLHDRVQQAAYALIEDSQKKAVHLRIGRMLLANTPPQYRSERIFELVDHLNVARSLIAEEEEKIELASLNLEAGKKAKDATAYVAAQQYLTAGMEILTGNIWEEHYELALGLYKERAAVEYLNGNYEKSEEFINLTLEKVRSLLEKAEVYNLLIVQYTMMAKYQEAVVAGKKILSLLGIEMPEEDLQTAIGAKIAKIQEKLRDLDISSLLDAPEMTLPEKKMVLKLFNNLAPASYLSNPQVWMVNTLMAVSISLEYGVAPETSVSYANYALIVTGLLADYKTAYDFCLLARKLSEKWGNREFKCKVYSTFSNALTYWFKHIRETEPINNEGYQDALDSGDLLFAGYILNYKLINAYFQGRAIANLITEASQYLQFSQKTKNHLVTDTVVGTKIALGNLSKLTRGKLEFYTGDLSESEFLERCQANQNLYSICIYQIRKLQVFYIYGEIEEALKCTREAEKQLQFIVGTILVSEFNFFSTLIWLAVYPEASEEEKKIYWEKIEANQKQLKIWAENGPENFLHKWLLIEAEIARILGRGEEAIDLYDRAIESAIENEFVQHEALANELAAKFWLNKGKPKYAKVYITEAHYAYQRWGATRKVEDLEEKYPQFLAKTPTKTVISDTGITTMHTTTGSGSGELDLSTVMKASQAISSEIVLDKLLANLMKILIENAGAQKGFLILPTDGKLAIAAEASVTQEEVVVQQATLGDVGGTLAENLFISTDSAGTKPPRLPVTVINYVERTRSDVVLTNAASEGRFTTDPYILQRQLKSVLCTPILDRGKLIGILYLENNLTVGAFTPDRLEVLRLLSAQAAISLENALLYASLEVKVQERTQELNEKNLRLEQTLRELQRTQTQLIQSEKMSSLGQMVAGVAHEINNPVNFIYGNLSPASDYVKDLLNLIELYQEHYPNPVPEIEEEIETIELEFLVEDLQKLMDSMKVGAERIRQIVLSLRNFSRLDEASMKPVDIHEGIESTLLILQHRLKEKAEQRGIEIVKEYGKLPKVTCYASQLNQVLMNILNNALDALEEPRNKTNDSEFKPTIAIRTAMSDSNTVTIRIADNGPGIKEDIQKKIFDPFFTTKQVGSGTGLGLSISYSIVVEAHGGQLSCTSAPGQGAEFVISIPIKPKN